MMLVDYVFENYDFPAWQDWRTKFLWKNEVNAVFKANLDNIHEVHNRIMR